MTVQTLRKKEFTSFDIAAAIPELKATIADSRVNNIYQLNEKTLIFKLHKIDKPPIRLVTEAGQKITLNRLRAGKPKCSASVLHGIKKVFAWSMGKWH